MFPPTEVVTDGATVEVDVVSEMPPPSAMTIPAAVATLVALSIALTVTVRRDVEAGVGRAVAGRVAVQARQERRVAPRDRACADRKRADLGIQGRRHRRRAFLDGPDADTAAVRAGRHGPDAGEREVKA